MPYKFCRTVFRQLPAPGRIAWCLLPFFLAYAALGFFALPLLLKPYVVEKLEAALQRSVSLDGVAVNPFALSLRLDGLQVREKGQDERVAGFERLHVNLETVSLLRGALVLSALRIEKPYLKVVRLAENRYNHSDLLDRFMAQPGGATQLFSLGDIHLVDGAVDFDDRLLGEQHRADEIELRLPFISNLPHHASSFVVPVFAARIDGAHFAMQGRSQPFSDSHESEFTLTLDALPLAGIVDYLPLRPVPLVDSGTIGGEIRLLFRQEREKAAVFQLSGALGLDNLRVSGRHKEALLAVKHAEVALSDFDFSRRRLALQRIALDSPEIQVRVDARGALNWLAFLPEASEAKTTRAAPEWHWSVADARVTNGVVGWLDDSRGKAAQASVEGLAVHLRDIDSRKDAAPGHFDLTGRVKLKDWLETDAILLSDGRLHPGLREVVIGDLFLPGARAVLRRKREGGVEWFEAPALPADAAPTPAAPAWQISATHLRGADIALRLTDLSVEPAAVQTVDGLAFELENLSFSPDKPVNVAVRCKLDRNGVADVRGTFALLPFSGNLALDLKNIDLPAFQPYFAGYLDAAVTRGNLALRGDLQWAQKSAAGDAGLSGGFRGQATVSDVRVVSQPQNVDLLKWKSLYFGGIDGRFGVPANAALSIGEVALTDFFARAQIDSGGELNLLSLLKPTTAAPAAVAEAPPGKAALPVSIGKMTLQGGSLRFSDYFVKPNYSVVLRRIGGSLTGLSSKAGSLATLDLRGDYDEVAPVRIAGTLNPLAAQASLDLEADIRGVDMTPLSPYAGKYAGYAIERGKLSFFAKYKLENRQLSAENRIFLDQLTFGEPVDSPEATRLPVTLALALLKNRRGEVEINLPVSGSLDDPEFSIGGIVWRLLGNFLLKAVSSPFALLGNLFGGGEELSFVDFDEGRHTLNDAGKKRLETLVKALDERPDVRLGIGGRADLERDPEGLKRAMLENTLKRLKRDDLLARGETVGSLGAINIGDDEYPALLARAYRAGNFPKPRNLIGWVKELPTSEMEKLLLSHQLVGEDELRTLADRRAQTVREWLLAHSAHSGETAQRLFLQPVRLEGREHSSEEGRAQRASRVDFSLK